MIKDILTPQKMKEELKTLNLTQIAKKYGVTKQYISQLYAEYQSFHPELFRKNKPSEQWLKEAIKTKSIIEICNETGLSYHHIKKLMLKYGIEKPTVTATFDIEDIRHLYVNLWWSDKSLADKYGCSAILIKKFRYSNQIFKTDRLPLACRLTKPAAEYLLKKLQLSLREMCEVYDVSEYSINKVLKELNLAPREISPDKRNNTLSIFEIKEIILSKYVEQ